MTFTRVAMICSGVGAVWCAHDQQWWQTVGFLVMMTLNMELALREVIREKKK